MEQVRVAVLGAGSWAESAHIPGWQRDPRSVVAVICDPVIERAGQHATKSESTIVLLGSSHRPGGTAPATSEQGAKSAVTNSFTERPQH